MSTARQQAHIDPPFRCSEHLLMWHARSKSQAGPKSFYNVVLSSSHCSQSVNHGSHHIRRTTSPECVSLTCIHPLPATNRLHVPTLQLPPSLPVTSSHHYYRHPRRRPLPHWSVMVVSLWRRDILQLHASRTHSLPVSWTCSATPEGRRMGRIKILNDRQGSGR